MIDIVMTFCRFRKDKNFNAVGDPLYTQIRGQNATEINQIVDGMRLNNDMVKYTPWQFVRLDSAEAV